MSYFKRIKQDIQTSTGNSSTANLAVDATFTGAAEETFGINGIQIYHYADQNCEIYLEQSLDATNWDVVDEFSCLANFSCTRTIQSVAPYFRIRVTNIGQATTTELRVAAGMTPFINPLPRALSVDGRLKTESTLTSNQNLDRHAFISPLDSLTTNTTVRLVGTSFDGSTKDTNFWTETIISSGVVTQGGEIVLETGTDTDGSAQYQSVRRGRFIVSGPMKFFGFFALVTAPVADNVRRIGAYDLEEGFFFEISGLTMSVGSRKGGSDTKIENGNFNGNYGTTWSPESGETYYRAEIEYGLFGALYYIDGKLLHKILIGHLTNTLTLPINMENYNNGSTKNSIMDCLGAAIIRQGEYQSAPIGTYIEGDGQYILKYGSGVLHTIINNDNTGNFQVYDDNTGGGANKLADIDSTKVLGSLEFNIPFSNGLQIDTTNCKITIVYE